MKIGEMKRGSSMVPWHPSEPRPFVAVSVEINDQHLGFSRYASEIEWYCDSHIGANGYPYFVHGEGSRCTVKSAAVGELKTALDQAYEEFLKKEVYEEYLK